jgi:hypothetical protein
VSGKFVKRLKFILEFSENKPGLTNFCNDIKGRDGLRVETPVFISRQLQIILPPHKFKWDEH